MGMEHSQLVQRCAKWCEEGSGLRKDLAYMRADKFKT